MFVIDGIVNTYLTSCFMFVKAILFICWCLRIIKNVVVTGNCDSGDNYRRKYINVFDFVNKLKFAFIDKNELSRDLYSIRNILAVAFKVIFYPIYENYFTLWIFKDYRSKKDKTYFGNLELNEEFSLIYQNFCTLSNSMIF